MSVIVKACTTFLACGNRPTVQIQNHIERGIKDVTVHPNNQLTGAGAAGKNR